MHRLGTLIMVTVVIVVYFLAFILGYLLGRSDKEEQFEQDKMEL